MTATPAVILTIAGVIVALAGLLSLSIGSSVPLIGVILLVVGLGMAIIGVIGLSRLRSR